MKLLPNWRAVVRKAWSVRLLALAGVLSGIEAALPYLDWLPIERGTFALLSFTATCGALIARVVAQNSLSTSKEASDAA